MDLPPRTFQFLGEARYERLTGNSNGYPHNARRSQAYARVLVRRAAARPSQALSDTSLKPRQEGRPS